MTKIVDFAHLHCHSEFSVLDGMPKVEDYIIKSAELGFPAFALTEHGNMRSMVQLMAKSSGNFTYQGEKYKLDPIKPIFGCEFYLAPTDYRIKGIPADYKSELIKNLPANELKEILKQLESTVYRKRWHALLLAKDKEGMQNLLTLNYLSWKNGFYYRPRIDFRLLKKYSKGLIMTTSCIGGVVPDNLLKGKDSEAEKALFEFKKIFNDDLYVEIQPHNFSEQKIANIKLIEIANEHKVKIIATNDCHYLNKEDYVGHDALLAIQSNQTLQSQDRWRFSDNGFYLRSKDEMFDAFSEHHKDISKKDIKNALENTMEIVDKCNYKFELNKKQGILPNIEIPDEFTTSKKYIVDLCKKGWKWRRINKRAREYAVSQNISYSDAIKRYKTRLRMELKRIFKMKFENYFLMVYDIINYSRSKGIIINSRGSASGSLVCYLLGFSLVDPVRYDLLFDRFLNIYRVDYPDIDLDIQDERRKQVFDYLFHKYGKKNVCMIGTVGRLKGKQALKDIGRVKGISPIETGIVTKNIIERSSGDARNSQTVEDSFKEFEVCREYNKKYPDVLPLVKLLEGKARQVGIHAAGIQIAPFPLYNYIPIEYRKDKDANGNIYYVPVSGIDWRDSQDMGLIKLDLLGLGTLSALKYSVEEIKRRHRKEINLEDVSVEDKNVFDNFSNGLFAGIFQFDSIGMRKTCEKLTFTCFDDIIIMDALYRPGAMRSGESQKFIERKIGKQKIKKIHPVYDEITKATYGIMVYQEQLMMVFMKVAGYMPGKADIVRKKVAKSTGTEDMWAERKDFMDGAKKNNVPNKIADWLFKNMSFFGSYAFNKAHAASYAMIGYMGMWLKTYYPIEYYFGLLKQEKDAKKMPVFIKEARKYFGINVSLPNINLSDVKFSIVSDNEITVGFVDLKGVGDKAAAEIVKKQPYKSLYEFGKKVNRTIVNKRVIQSLIYAGAFKSLYPNTAVLLTEQSIERIGRNKTAKIITKQIFEWMLEEKTEHNSELVYKLCAKKIEPLNEEQEERLQAKVSPLPSKRHETYYYKYLRKMFGKHTNYIKVKNINCIEDRAVIIGNIADIKYNQVGDFHKEKPDRVEMERIGWGRRYAALNIEDSSGVVRMSCDHLIFPTYRHIIDKGIGTTVIATVGALRFGNATSGKTVPFIYSLVDADNFRLIMDSDESLKRRYKKLNTIEKMLIKHPVSFVKERKFKIIDVKSKDGGIFELVVLISKAKFHWTKNNDHRMMFIDIEDETGVQGIVMWSDMVDKYEKKLKVGNIIKMKVKKDGKGCIAYKSKIKVIKKVFDLVP
jgi:DNA polymerase-3 subunit alpha